MLYIHSSSGWRYCWRATWHFWERRKSRGLDFVCGSVGSFGGGWSLRFTVSAAGLSRVKPYPTRSLEMRSAWLHCKSTETKSCWRMGLVSGRDKTPGSSCKEQNWASYLLAVSFIPIEIVYLRSLCHLGSWSQTENAVGFSTPLNCVLSIVVSDVNNRKQDWEMVLHSMFYCFHAVGTIGCGREQRGGQGRTKASGAENCCCPLV